MPTFDPHSALRDASRRTLVALVAVSVAVALAGCGGDDRSEEDGPDVPENRIVFRAIGDSVTAAFGYEADGDPVPFFRIVACGRDELPLARCQSPDRVAYPAVFARSQGIPMSPPYYDNLAVSGATPADWASPAGRFHAELLRVARDDPALTVLTLGANPLLRFFLFGAGQLCARDSRADAERCVERKLQEEMVVARLRRVYETLLDTPEDGRNGRVVVFHYHEADPVTAGGCFRFRPSRSGFACFNLEVLIEALRGVIERAVEETREAKPEDAARLVLAEPGDFGERPCAGRRRLVLKTDGCIHPSAEGHRRFATALEEAVGD